MATDHVRAERPRRIAVDPTPSPSRFTQRLRRGLALTLVSGLTAAAIGAFAVANYTSTGQAYANQSTAAPEAIQDARDGGVSRAAAERPAPTFEDLVKQRAAAIAQVGDAVETQRYSDAAAKRNSQLKKTAAAIEQEAERLRNLAIFLWPTEGGVGSPWGMRLHPILHYYRLHGGADIGGRCGQPIYAAQSGTVTKAATGGYNGGSGNNVRIDHGDINGVHVETAYLHMSEIAVKDGQAVNKGDLLGTVGNTGLSTACHLHLSLYKNGVNSDPLEYVKKPAAHDKQEPKGDENSADRELGDGEAAAAPQGQALPA